MSENTTAADLVKVLRSDSRLHPLCVEAANEIDHLLDALRKIDRINDNPARYSSEINAVLLPILYPELVDD